MALTVNQVTVYQRNRDRRILVQLKWLGRWAVIVFALGTFTWRTRSATSISDNPVDGAASIRLAADALAVGLIALGLGMDRHLRSRRKSLLPPYPAVLFGAYVAVGVLGVASAIQPTIVMFRVFELTVCLAIALCACRWLGLEEVIALIRRIIAFTSVTIVVSALAVPSVGFEHKDGGIVPFRLAGVFPEFSANSVGNTGVILFALSVRAPNYRRLGIFAGTALVLLSQYRTGYIALAVVIAVYLLTAGKIAQRIGFVLSIPLAVVLYQSALFQDAWVRGEQSANSVANLSGRTFWWSAAIHATSRSPIFGLGLSSGTRWEILLDIFNNGEASTIHGTWIEIYTGTGILGTLTMGSFVIVSVMTAWRIKVQTVVPLLFIAATLVRSLTGTTIELASTGSIFFLLIVIAAHRELHGRPVLTRGLAEMDAQDRGQADGGKAAVSSGRRH